MTIAFRMLLRAREKLYKAGIFATKRLNHPVISVGNLTVGGTGKTPLVITLAERLRTEGFNPVVLSRGYKRTTKGVVIVSRGHQPLVTCEEAGDEPFLIACKAQGVPVVVGADRYEAGRTAERASLGDLFILDDGFQHLRLHRAVDLVTIDPYEWEVGGRLLPFGLWREPKSAVGRATAACVQHMQVVPPPPLPVPVFLMEIVVDGLFDGNTLIDKRSLENHMVTAFAGIAKPKRFLGTLQGMKIQVHNFKGFPDHHQYSAHDFEKLGGGKLITTEKDAVRLKSRGITGFLHVRLSVKIPEFDGLIALIRDRLSAQ